MASGINQQMMDDAAENNLANHMRDLLVQVRQHSQVVPYSMSEEALTQEFISPSTPDGSLEPTDDTFTGWFGSGVGRVFVINGVDTVINCGVVNAGTLAVGMAQGGGLYAGDGVVTLNEDGIVILSNSNFNDLRAYTFSDGTNEFGGLYGLTNGSVRWVRTLSQSLTGDSALALQSISPSGSTSEVNLLAGDNLVDDVAAISVKKSAANLYTVELNSLLYNVDTNINGASGPVLTVDASAENVGIGTTTPDASYKLDVNGDIRANNLTLTGGTIIIPGGTNINLANGVYDGYKFKDYLGNNLDGLLGYATSTASEMYLRLANTLSGRYSQMFVQSQALNTEYAYLALSAGVYSGSSAAVIMYAAEPDQDYVSFQVGATERGYIDEYETVFESTGFAHNFRIQASAESNMLFMDWTNKRIGIRNGSPAYTVDVTGNVNATTGYYINGVALTAASLGAVLVANTTAAQNTIQPTADVVNLTLKQKSSGTQNLTDWLNNSGGKVAQMSLAGWLSVGSSTAPSHPLHAQRPIDGSYQYGIYGRVDSGGGYSGSSGITGVNSLSTDNGYGNQAAITAQMIVSSGNQTAGAAFWAALQKTGSGTLTSGYGLYVDTPYVSSATITSGYGIYIADQNVAGTNYAIYTNAGKVRIGDDIILADGADLQAGTSTGSKIGLASSEKWGFWGATPTTRPTALTTQLTTITHTAPGTPDYAIQDFVDIVGDGSLGWSFASHDEANSVLKVIANLQTRLSELESKMQTIGLLA